MDENIQRELEIIKEGVLQTVPNTEAIYLFGSYAYGTPHKDSDLDIYVVVPDDMEWHPVEISADIYYDLYVNRKLSVPADIMVNRASIFKRRSQGPTLQRTIATKGVRIYGA